jgi:hypothetical protein
MRIQSPAFAIVIISLCLSPCFGRRPGQQGGDLSKLIGDWSGESICVGNNPSCHDEKVIYHISRSSAGAGRVTLAADKIVDGKPEPMGELEFTYDSRHETLTGEFQNARYHGLWEYAVKGNIMEGTLSLLPDKTIVRRIKVIRNGSNQMDSKIMSRASGTFEVKLTPQDDKGDASLGRLTIDKQWQGDLEGTSKGQMLTGGDVAKGSAGYVAIEKVSGNLKGRKGTFVLQHSGTMTRGEGQLTITVVPDSGTEELQGLTGKMTIKIENGKHFYEFDYTLPGKP